MKSLGCLRLRHRHTSTNSNPFAHREDEDREEGAVFTVFVLFFYYKLGDYTQTAITVKDLSRLVRHV